MICLHFKDPCRKNQSGGRGRGRKKKEGAAKRTMCHAPAGHEKMRAQGQGFRGAFCVEYEYNWDNSMPEIAECKKFFDATCAELAGKP